MADSKASSLTAASALSGAELWAGAQGGADRKITASQILTYVMAAIVDAAPATLDTLNELAAALGDDPNFATTVTTALAGKQPLDSDLTAIAALTTTTYGRALLALADAAAADWLAKTGGTLSGALDVQAEVRCDSFRMDATPSASAATPSTHKVAVNLNGTTYYLLLSNV